MKRLKLKMALGVLVLVLGALAMSGQVFAAECGKTSTIIIDCGSSSGEDSICHVLNLVVRIMTTGIGILAILGIIVVGIQYLTSSDNEEKLRKSKRRLLELVIGVVIYVLAGALLQWLLPGGTFCGNTINNGGGGGGGGTPPGGAGLNAVPDGNSQNPLDSNDIPDQGLPPNGDEGWPAV